MSTNTSAGSVVPFLSPIGGSALLLAFILLGGCGGGGDAGTSLGNWTLSPEGLSLAEDLLVSETEAFFFGSTSDLDVTSDGRFVVADRSASNIKILRPDGSLVDTLGRSGNGPGEFNRLRSVQVARGDSIYAFDLQQSRLTVFGPTPPHEVVRTVTIPREQGWALQIKVFDEYLAGDFNSDFQAEEGVSAAPPQAFRRVSELGVPGDTITMTRQSRAALSTSDGGFSIWGFPFGRQSLIRRGPDGRVYTGWTDSLRVVAYGVDGAAEVVADVPAEPVPVTVAERDSALAEITHDALRADIKSAMNDTKPSFTDLVVAEDGTLWVQRPAKGVGAPMRTWWRLDPEARAIHAVELPTAVDLEVVRDGMAYGTTETEVGAPAVVRYDVSGDS